MQIFDIKCLVHQSYYHEHFLVLDLEYNTVRVQQFSQHDCINVPIIANTFYETVANLIEYESLWDFLKQPNTKRMFSNIFNDVNKQDVILDLQNDIQKFMSSKGILAVGVEDVYSHFKSYYDSYWTNFDTTQDILNGNEQLFGDVDDIERYSED